VTHRLEMTRAAVDRGPKRLHRTASASRVKRLHYKATHNLYLFRCWIWYPTDQVRQGRAIAPSVELARHVSNWDTNATGLRTSPFRAGLLSHTGADRTYAAGTKTIRVGSGGVMLPIMHRSGCRTVWDARSIYPGEST